MADEVRKVDYYYTTTANKPGEAARLLSLLEEAGVNLLAFSGFPSGRKAQIDFVPEDPAAFLAAARKAKVKLSPRKSAFLVRGDDRVGAVADVARRLGDAGINMTSLNALTSGNGRFASILWVKPKDMKKAAKVLGAG